MKHKTLCPGMSYVSSGENKIVFEVFYIAINVSPSQHFKAISTNSHSAVFHDGLEELICLTTTNDKGDLRAHDSSRRNNIFFAHEQDKPNLGMMV